MNAVGFVGLGNMGGALATNLVEAGLQLVCTDVAGPDRCPQGASWASSVGTVAQQSDVMVLSLPDGKVSELVAREILAASDRCVTHVIDTTTAGVNASRSVAALLADGGVAYVDSPVSGGVDGAKARTLAVMYAASDDACAHVEPVLAGLSDRRIRVGDGPGMAQAMKLANNFLSATALTATSEAMAFGQSVGLDMATMLEVLNASSGRNSATLDKFPNHVLNGRYASGFVNTLMAKDLLLYLAAAEEFGCPTSIGSATESIWERFAAAEPGVDFTRIYPFVEGS